ncbi:C56D2 protein, partial [Brachypodius atriceps]|nr:C56D2 protein [Brachypodius atriceps]
MALTAETESRLYRSLRVAAGAAAHLVALGFPAAVAVLARPGSSECRWGRGRGRGQGRMSQLTSPCASLAGLFSWHPLLMALAFSFLMTEALLIFSPETSLLRSFSRKVRVRAHWALQLLALFCALLGLGIITYNKHLNGKGHFVTWHGLTGLLAVLYAGGQCAGGVLLLYPKLMKNWTLAKLKLYHATSGLVCYLLGCASLMLGMCSLWFTTTVTGASWYLAMLCPLVTSLVIMNQVSNAYLYRKRSQH